VVAVAHEWASRRDNPWISVVAVPLGMTAAGLLGQWWVWPILTLDASIASRGTWSWVLGLELGYVGTNWAFLGAYALGTWPESVILVGLVWAAFPAVLAGAVSHARHDSVAGVVRRAFSGAGAR
jgi:hypothetical protein